MISRLYLLSGFILADGVLSLETVTAFRRKSLSASIIVVYNTDMSGKQNDLVM